MNSRHEFEMSAQLDRLVDGALSGDEYRELLETLDGEPDGWRRCAMAFLESQAWQHELGELQVESRLSSAEASGKVTRTRAGNWSARQLLGLSLAMAASFVVAFASGAWWRVGKSSNAELDLPVVARQVGESHRAAVEDEPPREPDHKPTPRHTPAEHLTFVVDRGNGESDQFELPIYDANDSVARQLIRDSASLPADVERAIRDSGFQVKRRRQWTPVQLRDGRRAFFPVDQLDITPVSESIYH